MWITIKFYKGTDGCLEWVCVYLYQNLFVLFYGSFISWNMCVCCVCVCVSVCDDIYYSSVCGKVWQIFFLYMHDSYVKIVRMQIT
jgi:hypothetical protein